MHCDIAQYRHTILDIVTAATCCVYTFFAAAHCWTLYVGRYMLFDMLIYIILSSFVSLLITLY